MKLEAESRAGELVERVEPRSDTSVDSSSRRVKTRESGRTDWDTVARRLGGHIGGRTPGIIRTSKQPDRTSREEENLRMGTRVGPGSLDHPEFQNKSQNNKT